MGEIRRTASEKRFFSQFNQVKPEIFEKIKVVKMYEGGITILSREDSKNRLVELIRRENIYLLIFVHIPLKTLIIYIVQR